MAKKSKQPIRESAVKAAVRTPLYRMRVVKDKTKYCRKECRKEDRKESSRQKHIVKPDYNLNDMTLRVIQVVVRLIVSFKIL